MDSKRFQVTTHGRAALAACLARGAPVAITRVAVGSGRVDDGANLAEQHELVQRVADGTIGERRHEDDRLFLTVQYENVLHPEIPTFFLSEFLIYMQDPETGGETDFLYASLGEYIQPVPAYRAGVPATTLQYPVVLTLSGELEVTVAAPVGLATYRDLTELIDALGTRRQEIVIPADGWQSNPDGGAYPYRMDIPIDGVTAKLLPELSFTPESAAAAGSCGFCPVCETLDGALRLWSKAAPTEPIAAVLRLTGDASGYLSVGDGGGSGGAYTLPPATGGRLGGVKVGDGLRVTRDGTLSVNAASEATVGKVLDEALGPYDK